ncbi:hypothetical protein E3N88_43477 [Mikania micrantha]|uniref:K-box domain-containing protein n=1 Tax=Mikania micrantha TaxID=192012 RepID=A0A5N6LH07_9ASTR|nr:hypothetical protein E3N88_43477 [Mikania micrantha]
MEKAKFLSPRNNVQDFKRKFKKGFEAQGKTCNDHKKQVFVQAKWSPKNTARDHDKPQNNQDKDDILGVVELPNLIQKLGFHCWIITTFKVHNMESILERYERYSYAEKLLIAPEAETLASWTLESSKLKAKIEVLEKNIRHYAGEELDQLNLRDLQNVEQQIETALKRIRTKKNQAMHESISELHKKEKALQERNNSLSKKVLLAIHQSSFERGGISTNSCCILHHDADVDDPPH